MRCYNAAVMLRIVLCATIVVTAISVAVIGIARYFALQHEERSAVDGLLIASAVVVVVSLLMAAFIFRALRQRE